MSKRARYREKRAFWLRKPENREKTRQKASIYNAKISGSPFVVVRTAKAKRKFDGKPEIVIELPNRLKPLVCDVCWQPGRICFDHCHQTGKFRGWICQNCNLALGNAKDSPHRLRQLIAYLERK